MGFSENTVIIVGLLAYNNLFFLLNPYNSCKDIFMLIKPNKSKSNKKKNTEEFISN